MSGPGEFGALLRRLRLRAGQSQEHLAHAAGLGVRTVADLERGRARGPQRRTVEALTRALALDPDDARALEAAAALGRPRAVPAAPLAGTLALPRDLRDFTARTEALDSVRELASHTDHGPAPVALITGQPGLGKSAFAVHVAHLLAPDYPDGQLGLDLRGTDERPTDPREALARLLRALAVDESAIPRSTEERSGLWRTLTADRRLLILLDNAADEDQVRPMLPDRGTSLTLVTSRHSLAGLESSHRTDLGLLRREEAVRLLTRILGADRVAAEEQAARDLADLCGRLPLAIRVAGQRLAARPAERVGTLVSHLTDEERRLDALRAGSLEVRAAFALSYRRLAPPARTLLRRAALAQGPDFSAHTLALLADLPLRRARQLAEDLEQQGLLQATPQPDRYRFHDLLRLFAAEQLAEEDDPAAIERIRSQAARRLLARAEAAAAHFDAEHDRPAVRDPDPSTAPTDAGQARAWLEAEREQWLWALRHAHDRGLHREVVDTAEAMHWFSDRTQHWEQWTEVFELSAASAEAIGSRAEQAAHLNYLAWAHNLRTYDHQRALETADRALAAALAAGDRLQQGWALGYGAGALHRLGRTEEATARMRSAADCHRRNPDPRSRLAEVSAWNALGTLLRDAGEAGEALTVHRRSEAICHAGIPGQTPTLHTVYLAITEHQLGCDLAALTRWSEAEPPLRRALAAFESLDMPAWSEPVRLDLAVALHHQGHRDEARAELTTAHRALVGLNHRRHTEAADLLHKSATEPAG
ncbi:helix-turn-helix domain-containing protein [Kitasatospora sp. NPDC004615]|uniref:helix-turn-helix domain-containing protein n=1 Tax=Kitasatospora sp. NPDC004615 TaxID=3364017 RepID=UPI0036894EBC